MSGDTFSMSKLRELVSDAATLQRVLQALREVTDSEQPRRRAEIRYAPLCSDSACQHADVWLTTLSLIEHTEVDLLFEFPSTVMRLVVVMHAHMAHAAMKLAFGRYVRRMTDHPYDTEANATIVVEAGGIELIVDALRVHAGDALVASEMCHTLSHLLLQTEDGRWIHQALQNADFTSALELAIVAHMDSEWIILTCLKAAVMPKGFASSLAMLPVRHVATILRTHRANVEVQLAALRYLDVLHNNGDVSADELVVERIAAEVTSAMCAFPAHGEMQQCGLGVLAFVAPQYVAETIDDRTLDAVVAAGLSPALNQSTTSESIVIIFGHLCKTPGGRERLHRRDVAEMILRGIYRLPFDGAVLGWIFDEGEVDL